MEINLKRECSETLKTRKEFLNFLTTFDENIPLFLVARK